mmetsp:Transcript_23651/g.70922  ORF Transcript_23651/g.70922 Transcript_23651/m.70922 type:complete len:271 (+) Transcript_23651:192-1004(+)
MPLRNIILLAPSGLVLFAKEYGHAAAQPRLLGSLLTAMTEFATQTTAMRPSYIEMSSMAVTMVWDDVAKLTCALVHDRTDTALFGRLLASEILLAFVEQYGCDGGTSLSSQNLKDFHSFGDMISSVVQGSVSSVLHKLSHAGDIIHTCVISEDSYKVCHVNQAGCADIDQLALLASSKYMFQAADMILQYNHDPVARLMTFDDERDETRTFLWRVEHCVLMVCVRKSDDAERMRAAFDECRQAKSLVQQLLRQSIQLRRPEAKLRTGSKR